MAGRKYQWMGIISLFLIFLLLSDSLMVHATEAGEIIGEGLPEEVQEYEINEEEIWAQINKDELRSLVDVDFLRDSIDTEKLREKIDREPLLEQIKDVNLLSLMTSEEITNEFKELKKSDKLDDFIKEEIESETFNEEYIKSHPPVVPNVKVPTISGASPLDYIIDPLELIYQTQAVKYGGGSVQEGANVLFRNNNGEYLFSDTSDLLEIVNKSNVPLQVSISARIDNTEDVRMADSGADLTGDDPSLFMALVGKEGILSVLNDSGSLELSIILDPVPEGTYVYTYNEETESFDSQMSETADESKFDRFCFGVTSRCNPDADWSSVDDFPKITVVWKTEPVLTGWDEVTEELEEDDKVKFEAFKRAQVKILREKEIEKLVDIQLEDAVNDELLRLIDEEVERLALERFEELKDLAVMEYVGSEGRDTAVFDGENEVILIENEGSETSSEKNSDAGNLINEKPADDGDITINNTEGANNATRDATTENPDAESAEKNNTESVEKTVEESNVTGESNGSSGENGGSSEVLGAVRPTEETVEFFTDENEIIEDIEP